MAPSMYDMTIPLISGALKNTAACLKKAEEHAKANNVALNEYEEGRLAPDMHPFYWQIISIAHMATMIPARLGGLTEPTVQDNEKTFEEFHKRLASTQEWIDNVKREDLEGAESKDGFKQMGQPIQGLEWCQVYAIPNFYFHVAAAYAILRHKGVPVGKADYLGTA